MAINLFKRRDNTQPEDSPSEEKSEKTSFTNTKQSFAAHFLNFTHQIKLSPYPLFIQYAPQHFALTGAETRKIMELVKPGDILVQAYNRYMDGLFLRTVFKRVGIYLGHVTEPDLKNIAHVEHPTHFLYGPQIVIFHDQTKAQLTDIIDFCRCDGLAVMRFPTQLKINKKYSLPDALTAYFEEMLADKERPHHALFKAEKDLATLLVQGKVLEFQKIFKIIYRLALLELSQPHPQPVDFEPFSPLTDMEFSYFIFKSIIWNYGLVPTPQTIFFKQRQVITADNFIDSDLEEVWKIVK